jgi:membrane protease YdiL (CAAX protease family)
VQGFIVSVVAGAMLAWLVARGRQLILARQAHPLRADSQKAATLEPIQDQTRHGIQPAGRASSRGKELAPPGSEGGQSFGRLPCQHRWVAAVVYALGLGIAEGLTAYADARAGIVVHIAMLALLLVHAALTQDKDLHKLLAALSLAPMIRIASLSLPLPQVPIVYWYLLAPAPILLGAMAAVRIIGLSRLDLGLTLRRWPLQLAVVLVVGTWLAEEFTFRGVIQPTATGALGKAGVPYVALVFALLHLGYKSLADLLFVFGVGLIFGYVVLKTRSILGVTLSHSLTNVTLFLLAPLVIVPWWNGSGPLPWQERSQPLVWAELLEPTPAPAQEPPPGPAIREQAREPPPWGPLVHVVAAGENLTLIALRYGTTVDELVRLNGIQDPNLIWPGQRLLLPSSSSAVMPGPPPP